jgi:AcrR family transcriptional regulator
MNRPDLLITEDLLAEPRQKRSIEKRVRVKKAALALFGERGYEATSVEAIADRAGLPVGGFYLHFRSKRQLLVTLMDELLRKLEALDLRPRSGSNVRDALRQMLAVAFAADLEYLGAYRAWQEAALSDSDLSRKQRKINAWTTARVAALLQFLEQQPGARSGVDIPTLARVLDSFFWSLLAQAVRMRRVELNRWLDSSTHLIYHAMFFDAPSKSKTLVKKPLVKSKEGGHSSAAVTSSRTVEKKR